MRHFVGHQRINAVKCYAAVVADDAAAAISIGQAGEHAGLATAADIGGVNVKHALVMGFAVFGEGFLHFGIQRAFVDFAGIHHHFQAAVRHNGAFERLIGLQADDGFQIFIDIAGGVGVDAGHDLRVDFVRRVGAVFHFDAFHHIVPQFNGGFGGRCQKVGRAFIRRVVFLDEITNIDIILPIA